MVLPVIESILRNATNNTAVAINRPNAEIFQVFIVLLFLFLIWIRMRRSELFHNHWIEFTLYFTACYAAFSEGVC